MRRRDARLEAGHHVGVGRVVLAALAELVEARILERRLLGLARVEAPERVGLEPLEPHAADRGGRAAEEAPAQASVEPDRLEQAGAAVARHVGDAGLRHHLEHAVLQCMQEARLRLLGRRAIAADLVGRGQARDRLEREPRADDVRAVPDERRDHMRVAGLVARDEERARRPQAALDEPPVCGRNREQRGNRRPRPAGRAVADAHRRRAAGGEVGARVGDTLHRPRETLVGVEGRVDVRRPERREAVRRDEERGKRHERRERAVRVVRRARADERRDGHHRALPLVVDRRVRDLREALPEVRRERTCAAGQRRDRRIVSHRVDRVATGLRDRSEHEAQLLAGVAVQRVAGGEVLLGHGDRLALLAEHERVGHPTRVWPRAGERSRELAVEEDAALGVDGEELAGREARPPHRDSLGQRHGARLGRDRDEPVGADGDAQRPEPVPVELRAARRAVREHEPRGPVPGLGEHRVVAAHRPFVLVDARVVLPRRGNEPRKRLADLDTRADEELDGVVEERRVGARDVERGRQRRVEPERTLAGLRPGDVALDRVDLTVVAEEPERLRPLPARLGVRREALVEDRPGRLPCWVAEVGVEARELGRRAERLVRHRAERE